MPRPALNNRSKKRITSRAGTRSVVQAGAQDRRRQSLERSVAALHYLQKSAPLEVWEAIATHLESAAAQETTKAMSAQQESRDELARLLTGDPMSGAELVELETANLADYFARRRELLHDTLSAPQVAALLHTSRQTPHDRVKADALLAVLDRGALRFPRWQFDPQGPDGVLTGLPEVLRALAMPPLVKVSWFTRPQTVLGNRTPLATLQAGDVTRVVMAARAAETT